MAATPFKLQVLFFHKQHDQLNVPYIMPKEIRWQVSSLLITFNLILCLYL